MPPANEFDARAKTWDDDPDKTARAQAVATGIRREVPLSPALRALEYGCGTGLLSFALRPDLGQITLADSSDGMLAVLQAKIADCGDAGMRAVKLDLVSDPLPADRYSLVYTMMTFHHITDTDKLLRDLHALIAAPGVLCVADLDREDGSFHGADFTGHKGFDREELGRQARAAGFARVQFTTVYNMTKVDGPGQTEFPLFLMVAEKG